MDARDEGIKCNQEESMIIISQTNIKRERGRENVEQNSGDGAMERL